MTVTGQLAFVREHAACRGMDINLFFPGQGQSSRKAKKVCAECPVLDECLEVALSSPETETLGIWAGTSVRERRRLRQLRRRAAA